MGENKSIFQHIYQINMVKHTNKGLTWKLYMPVPLITRFVSQNEFSCLKIMVLILTFLCHRIKHLASLDKKILRPWIKHLASQNYAEASRNNAWPHYIDCRHTHGKHSPDIYITQ